MPQVPVPMTRLWGGRNGVRHLRAPDWNGPVGYAPGITPEEGNS